MQGQSGRCAAVVSECHWCACRVPRNVTITLGPELRRRGVVRYSVIGALGRCRPVANQPTRHQPDRTAQTGRVLQTATGGLEHRVCYGRGCCWRVGCWERAAGGRVQCSGGVDWQCGPSNRQPASTQPAAASLHPTRRSRWAEVGPLSDTLGGW